MNIARIRFAGNLWRSYILENWQYRLKGPILLVFQNKKLTFFEKFMIFLLELLVKIVFCIKEGCDFIGSQPPQSTFLDSVLDSSHGHFWCFLMNFNFWKENWTFFLKLVVRYKFSSAEYRSDAIDWARSQSVSSCDFNKIAWNVLVWYLLRELQTGN